MSKRSPFVVVLSVAICFLSGYRGLGGLGIPLHSLTTSVAANPPPSELPRDVELLPSVIWPWVASAKYLALTFDAHFISTFDGRLYRLPKSLSSDCRHTLMRDRSSDRISTFIGNLNTLTIIAKQLTISIDENYQVKVNNSNLIRDLPLSSWDRRILVSREGAWISVESLDGGYMVTCSPLAKICMVILSSSYEGHSVGLLGTNDGNSSNDFLLRNGMESDNKGNFINSYEVTGMAHCLNSGTEDNRSGRRYIADNDNDSPNEEEEEEEEDDEDERAIQEEDEQVNCEQKFASACRFLFKSQRSTLAECFSKIDPVPFLNVCLDLMDSCSGPQSGRRVTNATDAAICSLAFSYSMLCSLRPPDSFSSIANITSSSSIRRNNNGSQILQRIPASCRGCSTAVSNDITQSPQSTRRKVDLIIVVSGLNNETSAYRIGQSLKHLLHELRTSLRTEHNVRDIRIGLVTHDDTTRPVSHTLKGLLFGTSHSHSSLESRLTNLDSNPDSASFPASAPSSSFHSQQTTINDALSLALKYPMRTLAVKQLLIVTTSINHTETEDLQHIAQESLRRGVQLNLWSLASGAQNNGTSLHRIVEATMGSVFHATKAATPQRSAGASYRQISRRLTHQIVTRLRQCQRCSTTCSPLATLDDLLCQPVQDGSSC